MVNFYCEMLPEPRFAVVSGSSLTVDFNRNENVFQEVAIVKSVIDTKTLVLGKLDLVLVKIEYDFDGFIRDESIVVFHGFGNLIDKTHWDKADLMFLVKFKRLY